jgi:hypothetical protein
MANYVYVGECRMPWLIWNDIDTSAMWKMSHSFCQPRVRGL